MVITELPHGLECWVEIGGRRVQEHDKPDIANDSTIREDWKAVDRSIKYIEAVEGKNFSVHVKKAEGFVRHCHHLGALIATDNYQTRIEQEPTRVGQSRGQEWVWDNRGFKSSDDQGKLSHHSYKFRDITKGR